MLIPEIRGVKGYAFSVLAKIELIADIGSTEMTDSLQPQYQYIKFLFQDSPKNTYF